MAFNVAKIKQLVKRQFGDEAQVQVSDSDIVDWINNAQRHIVSKNESLLQQVQTFNIVQGQQEYSVPGDCYMLRSVTLKYYDAYNHLRAMDLTKFDEYMDGWDGNPSLAGKPLIYTKFAEVLKLFPIPDINITSGLKIFYNRYPIDVVNDSDVPDLPAQYWNTIKDYVLQQAYELDEDWEASKNKAAQVQADILTNRHSEETLVTETYPTVTTMREDMWYS